MFSDKLTEEQKEELKNRPAPRILNYYPMDKSKLLKDEEHIVKKEKVMVFNSSIIKNNYNFQGVVSGEDASNIKAIYSETNALYLLNLPSSKFVYAFDTKGIMQNGSSRATIWDSIEPTSFCSRRNGDLLLGKNGYIGKYSTYLDDASSHRMAYYTNNSDLGDINVTSILKKIKVIVVGGSNQLVTLKWGYDFTGNYYSAIEVESALQEIAIRVGSVTGTSISGFTEGHEHGITRLDIVSGMAHTFLRGTLVTQPGLYFYIDPTIAQFIPNFKEGIFVGSEQTLRKLANCKWSGSYTRWLYSDSWKVSSSHRYSINESS